MYFEWKMDGWNKNKGGGGLYLHLGQNVVVRTDTIIGIFDIENTSMSRLTRHYLAQAEKKEKVIRFLSIQIIVKQFKNLLIHSY